MAIPWILIAIGVLVVVLGIVTIYSYKKRGKKHKPDYYTFFIIGLIWTAFGIIFFKDMSFFFIMGLVFLAIGLVNKDKWKKNHLKWRQLSKSEQKFKIIILMALGIILLAGLVAYLLFSSGVVG